MNKSLVSIVCASSVLAFALTACGADEGTRTSGDDPGTSSETFAPAEGDGADDSGDNSASEDGPTFEGGVLTTDDVKIEITRHKVIRVGEKGNEYGEKPVLALWYDITNLSGEDVDPLDFIFHFTAFQDNDPNAENQLEVAALPDDRFLDSQMETIKKGGTVENAIAYDLDDLTTPVELVAVEGLIGDEIGRATYKLN